MQSYDAFLQGKAVKAPMRGIDIDADLDLSGHLFPHQRDVTSFLLKAGRGAAFLDTGMGKTAVELEYGRQVVEMENKPVLLLAPLAVGKQHEREAARFDTDAKVIRDPSEINDALARIYNVHVRTIEKILQRDTWSHLP